MSNTEEENVASKRDVITLLYNNFTTELYKIIDLRQLFPENMEISDLVFNMSFLFGVNCDVKAVISDLIIIHNITHSDEQLEKATEIIETFLIQYNQV